MFIIWSLLIWCFCMLTLLGIAGVFNRLSSKRAGQEPSIEMRSSSRQFLN